MIQKIISKRVELPPIWLVENQEDWDNLPKGLPRILANKSELEFITVFLEFQVLLKSCTKTKLPIQWLDCLKRIGYSKVRKYELSSGGEYDSSSTGNSTLTVETFVEDSYLVNFDKLSELKILPVWLEDLKTSIETNIINEVIFDPSAFNKQLGMNVGAGAIKSNLKNLLILDVSGSIPQGVVVTITNLAKLMSKKFYADVMITSGQTVLIDYEDVQTSDIIGIAKKSGSGNEGQMYKKIVEEPRKYGTIVAFGDFDCPTQYGASGKLTPVWEIENIFSLHTDKSSKEVVGYAKHLKSKNVPVLVTGWVETLEKR